MSNQEISNSNRLWIARKKVGLAQKSVARLLGYQCTSPISEYENGRLLPNLRTALKLSIIYATPIPQLYETLYRNLEREVEIARHRAAIKSPGEQTLNNRYVRDPLKNSYFSG